MVFYGVSGYTGSLVMEYLKRECLDDVNVCFAGRTLHKVIAMRDKVLAGTRWAACDCISCDLKEPFEVEALVSSCRVVCNIAGPFMCARGVPYGAFIRCDSCPSHFHESGFFFRV